MNSYRKNFNIPRGRNFNYGNARNEMMSRINSSYYQNHDMNNVYPNSQIDQNLLYGNNYQPQQNYIDNSFDSQTYQNQTQQYQDPLNTNQYPQNLNTRGDLNRIDNMHVNSSLAGNQIYNMPQQQQSFQQNDKGMWNNMSSINNQNHNIITDQQNNQYQNIPNSTSQPIPQNNQYLNQRQIYSPEPNVNQQPNNNSPFLQDIENPEINNIKTPKDIKRGRSFGRTLLVIFIMVAIIFTLSWALREFVFQAYEIPSGSMEQTIKTGDMVFAEKVSKNFSKPKAGQIVTFQDPNNDGRILIKRILATEGQTVDIKNNKLYIDDEEINEPYVNKLPTSKLTSSKIQYPYVVPEGEVWVMGDNRTNSQDSRYFGSIPESTIIGHGVAVYWPLSDMRLLD